MVGLLAMLTVTFCICTTLRAEVITDSSGRRFHVAADGEVLFTYLAPDSANATAYSGSLTIPAALWPQGGNVMTVTGITPYACLYCSQLSSVSIATGIRRIGYSAFADCSSLQSVRLPQSLTVLSDYAFYRAAMLPTVAIPATVARIGASSFAYCSMLADVELSAGLSSIAPQAFYHCQSLTRVTIPHTVEQLGQYAFAYCTALREVSVQGAPLAISPDVFAGVDIAACRLIVPTDQVEAYRATDVWRDFQIVDGGYQDLPSPSADAAPLLYRCRVEGSALCITALADAPVLLYDLQGRRLAVIPASVGEQRVEVMPQRAYIVRCGHQSQQVWVP